MAQQGPANLLVRECPSFTGPVGEQRIQRGEIHIWHASPATHGLHPDAQELLSTDEKERMARFRFDTDRHNFLFCRSMLRILLASYLGSPPAELRFAYSAHGKPSLSISSCALEFNLSHTEGRVLLAVCLGNRVGVDVERIRRNFAALDIADRFFSEAEKKALRATPEEFLYEAFFHCWTRKEAFVKGRGDGLSCPLAGFDVSLAPEDEQVSLTIPGDSAESRRWQLWSLNNFPQCAAALAAEVNHGQ